MFSLPNIVSLCRVPLAFVFLQDNPNLRAMAIFLAMLSDGLDGYLARRYRWKTLLGTVLDPITDKFFVFFSLFILFSEHPLALWKIGSMLCRDLSVTLFGVYLLITGNLAKNKFRAIWCGKITTVLQLFVLLCMTYSIEVPAYVFSFFIIFGVLALIELYIVDRTLPSESP